MKGKDINVLDIIFGLVFILSWCSTYIASNNITVTIINIGFPLSLVYLFVRGLFK